MGRSRRAGKDGPITERRTTEGIGMGGHRRGRQCGQLTVWDSGEGELEFFDADGRVTQKHFDDLADDSVRLALADLEAFLAKSSG